MSHFISWVKIQNIEIVHLELFINMNSKTNTKEKQSYINSESVELNRTHPTSNIVKRYFAWFYSKKENEYWN